MPPTPHDRTVTILGRRWRLRYERVASDRWATCDDPAAAKKSIRISPGRRRYPAHLAELLIHEALHAAAWHLDEEIVKRFSADVTRILDQQGLIAK